MTAAKIKELTVLQQVLFNRLQVPEIGSAIKKVVKAYLQEKRLSLILTQTLWRRHFLLVNIMYPKNNLTPWK